MGNNNYIYVWGVSSYNYFGLSSVTSIGDTIQSSLNPGITVRQASMIDKKMDDGLPQSGVVIACYVNYNVVNYDSVWAAGGLTFGAGTTSCKGTTAATPYLSTNCYDNNNVAGPEQYSLANNADITNCALSFKMQ